MTAPVIIGSERSEVGLALGMDVLRAGGSAMDAVEATMRACEDNLADRYVGTGGLPNAQGAVELDASLMVASTRQFGAVRAIVPPRSMPAGTARRSCLPGRCRHAGRHDHQA